MSRIRPIWRIVLGFIFLCCVMYSSSELPFNKNFVGFAVTVAAFVTYVVFAIKTPYDDPLRSMRDLIAQQTKQDSEQKANENDAQKRIDALEEELAKLRERLDEKQ